MLSTLIVTFGSSLPDPGTVIVPAMPENEPRTRITLNQRTLKDTRALLAPSCSEAAARISRWARRD
jgi:hypothetical protein